MKLQPKLLCLLCAVCLCLAGMPAGAAEQTGQSGALLISPITVSREGDTVTAQTTVTNQGGQPSEPCYLLLALYKDRLLTGLEMSEKTEVTDTAALTVRAKAGESDSTCALVVRETEGRLAAVSNPAGNPPAADAALLKGLSYGGKPVAGFDPQSETGGAVLVPRSGDLANGAWAQRLYAYTVDSGTTVQITPQGAGTEADTPGECVIATKAVDGSSRTYRVGSQWLIHVVKGAESDQDFQADAPGFAHYNPSLYQYANGKSNAAVAAFATAQTGEAFRGQLFSGLAGEVVDSQHGTVQMGARYCTDIGGNNNHSFFYVDESLKGLDYFVFKNQPAFQSEGGTETLSFDLAGDAEVYILCANASTAPEMEAAGYTALEAPSAQGWARAYYVNVPWMDALLPYGIPVCYDVASQVTGVAGLDPDGLYDRLKDIYATVVGVDLDAAIPVDQQEAFKQDLHNRIHSGSSTTGFLGNTFVYNTGYSKAYRLEAGQESLRVTIPKFTTTQERSPLIVIKPL